MHLTTTEKRDVRIGKLAQAILEVAVEQPDNIYAFAITKVLCKRYGEKFTNSLDAGEAMKFLEGEGMLVRADDARVPQTPTPRYQYILTRRGAFFGHYARALAIAA